MLTTDEAHDIARAWRDRFTDEQAFETSWSRFFDMVGDPTRQKLEAWLAKDQAKDEIRHAGIVKEPLLPTRSRHQLSDCHHCGGLRYVWPRRRHRDRPSRLRQGRPVPVLWVKHAHARARSPTARTRPSRATATASSASSPAGRPDPKPDSTRIRTDARIISRQRDS